MTLAVAALFGAAPTAFAETSLPVSPVAIPSPVDGAWKVNIVADASARAAGCDDYEEAITIDGWGFTGQEIARLGFDPATPTTGMNAAGEITFKVSLASVSYGTWNGSGSFTIDNNSMSGTLAWLRDGQTYKYTFTGVRITPEPSEY